jgi:serine/threonine protein kinase
MLQANHRVGEYVLDERVGQCALEEVWRAHHHTWSDQLAMVKIATDPTYVANLRKEGIRVQRLIHPNILKPICFDSAADPPYLITEYVAGGPLSSWIAEKKISVRQAINILRQALSALDFSHQKGVVHGDVRPENILLDESAARADFAPEGSVKVTDFGIGAAAAATIVSQAAGHAHPAGNAVAYMAPEIRGGASPPDAKSDLYSMGVVLFEMLTGERPTGAELPSELNSSVAGWLDDIFRKSYARRERRYDSAKSFLQAVTAEGAVGGAMMDEPQRKAPSPARAASGGGSGDLTLQPLELIAPPPPRPAPSAAKPATQIMHEIEGIALSFQENPISLPGREQKTERRPAETGAASDIDLALAGDPEPAPRLPKSGESTTVAFDTPREQTQPAAQVSLDDAPPSPPPATGPLLPTIPHTPSRAERNCLYDELTKKQIKTSDDVQMAMRFYVETRRLDEGELANIRLRVIKWADEQAGGQADLRDHVALLEAVARPLYVIKLLMRTTRGDESPRTQVIEHPSGPTIEKQLSPDDYKLALHLSADTLNEKLLEATPQTSLRAALGNLSRTVRREFIGRIQREDVLIYRTNVIMASYKFDDRNYRVFMVGNALRVMALQEPFTRIRQEPTKRAAAMLDGKQFDAGLQELRRGLESDQWETKSKTILNALRGKLAAAYMVEAREQYRSFLWLESLDMSSKAGRLSPASEEALAHNVLVRRRVKQMQLFPGLLIAAIFVGLSILWGMDAKPAIAQVIVPAIVTSPFFVAGVMSLIATLVSRAILGIRLARTDIAFYQAMLLPIYVAGVIAPVQWDSVAGDICCLIALAIGVVADIMLLKYFRDVLIRPAVDPKLMGPGPVILDKIEDMLRQDWQMIRPHYMALAPLFSFTTVQTLAGDIQYDEAASKIRAMPEKTMDAVELAEPTTIAANDSSGSSMGGSNIAGQMENRVQAAARALAPPVRLLASIVAEYSKAMDKQQIGMMQANALKIEQRGKELAQKLGDFDRLCKTPLPQDPELSQRLAEKMTEPDIQLLRSLARCAKEFREDEKEAMSELAGIVDDAADAAERLKS